MKRKFLKKKSPLQKLLRTKGMAQYMSYVINDTLGVKAWRPSVEWFIRISAVVAGRRTSALVRANYVLIREIHRIGKLNGKAFLVKYLKACHILTMQASGGMVIHSPRLLGLAVSRTRRGLPRILPSIWRESIRSGNVVYIKLALTIFSLYRVLNIKGKLKLNTISDPGKDISGLLTEFKAIMPRILAQRPFIINPMEDLVADPYPISKTSSASSGGLIGQQSTSVHGILKAAVAIVANSRMFDHIQFWCDYTGNFQIMEYIFQWSEKPMENQGLWRPQTSRQPLISTLRPYWGAKSSETEMEQGEPMSLWSTSPGLLGKLSTKAEAAGKLRVFAMVDAFTNWLLKPLHGRIFDYLKGIPMDGTFDQHAPIKRLQKLGYTQFWCYDLSAATDRLPISLQVEVLGNGIIPRDLASAWAAILVDRPYYLRYPKDKLSFYGVPDTLIASFWGRENGLKLKYAVGQPMGALSSWAMLALTHHMIVQWAYLRVLDSAKTKGIDPSWLHKGKTNEYSFTQYAVLGDDIVIANKTVAAEYVRIMSDLGVGIGFEKSLISRKGGLEFAKRFYIKGQDCSPVPFKEFFAASGRLGELLQFKNKYKLSLAQLASMKGFGFRVLGSLSKPFTKLNKRIRVLALMVENPLKGDIYFTDWLMKISPARRRKSITHYGLWYALWEYIAFMQNTLTDRYESKVSQWDAFATKMGALSKFEESEEGLNLDPMSCKFLHGGRGQSTPRVASEISMVLYFDLMQKSFYKLKELEKELTEIYYWRQSMEGKICDSFEEIHVMFNNIHDRFVFLDEELSNIVIPTETEQRGSEEDERLLRNPLFLARLYQRLDAKIRTGDNVKEANFSSLYPSDFILNENLDYKDVPDHSSSADIISEHNKS